MPKAHFVQDQQIGRCLPASRTCPPPAGLPLSPRGPPGIAGARSLGPVSIRLWTHLEGRGRALRKVSGGHGLRQPGRSPRSRARALCSPSFPRLAPVAGASCSVPRKPWPSPGVVCTSGCAWLQRWHLSWVDLWWVSVPTPSPDPSGLPGEKRENLGLKSWAAALGAGPAELRQFQQNWKLSGMHFGLPNKVCQKFKFIKCSLSSGYC